MFVDTKNILVGKFNWASALVNTVAEDGASYSTGSPIQLAKCKGRNKWIVVDGHHRLSDWLQGYSASAPTFEFGELNAFQKSILDFHGVDDATDRLETYVRLYKPEWTRIFG